MYTKWNITEQNLVEAKIIFNYIKSKVNIKFTLLILKKKIEQAKEEDIGGNRKAFQCKSQKNFSNGSWLKGSFKSPTR